MKNILIACALGLSLSSLTGCGEVNDAEVAQPESLSNAAAALRVSNDTESAVDVGVRLISANSGQIVVEDVVHMEANSEVTLTLEAQAGLHLMEMLVVEEGEAEGQGEGDAEARGEGHAEAEVEVGVEAGAHAEGEGDEEGEGEAEAGDDEEGDEEDEDDGILRL